jgi:two-component system LytT family response regulator
MIMKPFVNEPVFEPMSIPFPKSVEKIADSVTTQKLLIPFYDRKRTVSADEIVRLEGCGNYTNFFLKDGTKMLVSRTLKEYETLLTDASFVRVHKSCIVNLSFVRKFFIKKEGELELIDGQQVKISRRRAQMFMDRIRSYQSVLVN